jgi:hypothetical protein
MTTETTTEEKRFQQVQLDYDDYEMIKIWATNEGRTIKGMIHVMVLDKALYETEAARQAEKEAEK